MKRISFLLLALALIAGCSSSTDDASDDGDTGSTESDVKKGRKPKLSCASVGGACIGLSPYNCQGGIWADANAVTCGGGLGVACCVKPQPPPPPPPDPCPTLSPPSPTFCTGGTITPKKDANGCIVGYDCTTQCASKGGQCVGLSPSSCIGGTWADASTHACGSGIGVGCCLP
jgi:hypothetical protein